MVAPLQEQHCHQGDETVLQKVLDESRRASQSGTQVVSMKTFVNAFHVGVCSMSVRRHSCSLVRCPLWTCGVESVNDMRQKVIDQHNESER